MTEDDGLSTAQRRAVPYAIAAPTLTSAATTSGVSEASLRRWQRQPAFAAAVDAGRRDLARQALGGLAAAQGRAVQVLVDALEHGQPYVRLRAATSLLDLAAKHADLLALDARLRDLEADRAA